MKNELEKLSYSLGANVGASLKAQGITDLDLEIFMEALNDQVIIGDLKMSQQEMDEFLQDFFGKKQAEQAEKAGAEGQQFLAENAKKDGVTVTESGLQYEVMKEGAGELPKAADSVTTHYHGTLISGQVFDSSVERGEPATFPVNGVIPGWVEALQLMPVGSKWKLFVPSELAYGDRGAGPQIAPHTALIFEVELIGIN
jgi:FKBP-type peptidyl-prolyl cis-trans isomerase FklB|tara:strand:- start:3013 stop:3609 length:597 start_codon:yes stop_codon:yes gene_type:complete